VKPVRRKSPARTAEATNGPGCACAKARQAARVLTQMYDFRLRGVGIEAPQLGLLRTLQKRGPCSQAALCRRCALDKTTMSRNLRLLERNGWVAFSETDDRREHQVTLTPAGRKLIASAKPEWKKAQEALRSAMTAAQWDAMFQAFDTAIRAAHLSMEPAQGRREATS